MKGIPVVIVAAALLGLTTSAHAELRHVEIKTLGMD
jgi:hypothetical protein